MRVRGRQAVGFAPVVSHDDLHRDLAECAALPHIENRPSMQLFVTTTYERAIRKLIPEAVQKEMEATILADPGREGGS